MRRLLAFVCGLVALAFASVGVVTLVTGEAPRTAAAPERTDDLAVGLTALAIGLIAALAARIFWRARHRDLGGGSGCAPLALGAALLATLAARFGDSVVRRADDLVPPPVAARPPHFSESAFFEEPLEAVGLLLDAHEAHAAFVTLRERLAADVIVSSRLALTGTKEVYSALGDGRYLLREQRTERHLSFARDGVLQSATVTVDGSLPDAAKGESIHLSFGAPPATAPTEREVTSITFEITELARTDDQPVTYELPNEVELVSTAYDAATHEVAVTLRTTASGQQRAAAALTEIMRRRMAATLTPAALGVERVELDVRVLSLAAATLTLTTTGVQLVTDGETVIDVVARGWR